MQQSDETVTSGTGGLWGSIAPYVERESLAAFFVGMSSGFPYAMIGATLTTRLAQDGIDKKTVTAFTLAFPALDILSVHVCEYFCPCLGLRVSTVKDLLKMFVSFAP